IDSEWYYYALTPPRERSDESKIQHSTLADTYLARLERHEPNPDIPRDFILKLPNLNLHVVRSSRPAQNEIKDKRPGANHGQSAPEASLGTRDVHSLED